MAGNVTAGGAVVRVDRAKCVGYTNCVVAAATVFEMDDDNIATVLERHPSGEALTDARRAVRLCPAKAIEVVDEIAERDEPAS